jgi:PAS domain-containing protein
MVETLNPAAERIFGYTAPKFGRNVSMLMPEPYRWNMTAIWIISQDR